MNDMQKYTCPSFKELNYRADCSDIHLPDATIIEILKLSGALKKKWEYPNLQIPFGLNSKFITHRLLISMTKKIYRIKRFSNDVIKMACEAKIKVNKKTKE